MSLIVERRGATLCCSNALAGAIHRNYRDAFLDGGIYLEKAPGTVHDLFALQHHKHARFTHLEYAYQYDAETSVSMFVELIAVRDLQGEEN